VSWRLAERGCLAVIEYDQLRLPGVRHGCVVKRAGRDIDEHEVYSALGRGKRLVVTEQTHSDQVAVVDDGFATHYPARVGADGLMTGRPGTVITIHTADCVPVLVAAPGAALLVHAGWRGSAQGIAGKAVREFARRYAVDPAEVRAVIGPCIGPECYEVGTDVAKLFSGRVKHERPDGKWLLDLRTANRDQLAAAGIRPENIVVSDHCTRCRNDLFHSYRREGRLRGTMIAFMEVGDEHHRY